MRRSLKIVWILKKKSQPLNSYLDAEEFGVLAITMATLQFGFPAPKTQEIL